MTSLRLCLGAALLAALPSVHAVDESDLPESLRSGYVSPIDGPANDEAYARGHLGIVQPRFGRASLYVAWRLMQLPPGAVASESHERRGNGFLGTRNKPYRKGNDEIDDWLQTRQAAGAPPLADRPDFFRTTHGTSQFAGRSFETTSVDPNCGADSFRFATDTLAGLRADASLSDADRRTWIAGQDAVFARCSWIPGQGPAPALPAALPAKAPAKLVALRAYQHAAALFYSDDFEHARQEFDAIAATPAHPMRTWAALGGLRSVVRPAGQDKDWQAAFTDAYTKRGLRGAELNAALAPASARRRATAQATMADVGARFKAIAADPAMAAVVPAAQYTARRAAEQLQPAVVVNWLLNALDHADWNPYQAATLDLWQQFHPRAVPDHPDADTLAFLRKHAFYDWISSVQGCSDGQPAADDATCAGEHAHALERWQATHQEDWLLATLITARHPSAADLPAADAALAVDREHAASASLRFYAARVLRAQGRKGDAGKALESLAGAKDLEKRDIKMVEAERQAGR